MIGIGYGLARAVDSADMVEANGGVVHDDGVARRHGMREPEYLADVGGDLLLAVLGVCRGVRGLDLLAAHGGDIRTAEVPADADDAVPDPIGCICPAAPRADQPSVHGDDLPVVRDYLVALSQKRGGPVCRGGGRPVGARVGIRDRLELPKFAIKLVARSGPAARRGLVLKTSILPVCGRYMRRL